MEGEEFLLRLKLCWDSPTGPAAASPPPPVKLTIQRGFSVTHNVSIMLPHTATARSLFQVIESVKGDEVVYTEDRLHVLVAPAYEQEEQKEEQMSRGR